MTLLGGMDSTEAEHVLSIPRIQSPSKRFRVMLEGPHNEETSTGLQEAVDIATKALHDRGYAVTIDCSEWDYVDSRDVVQRSWYRRLLAWLRFWR